MFPMYLCGNGDCVNVKMSELCDRQVTHPKMVE